MTGLGVNYLSLEKLKPLHGRLAGLILSNSADSLTLQVNATGKAAGDGRDALGHTNVDVTFRTH